MEIIALQITPSLAFFLNAQRMSSTKAEVMKAEVLQRNGDGTTADVSVTFRIPAGKIYVDMFSVRWDELERLGGLTGVEAEPYQFRVSDLKTVVLTTPLMSTDWSNITPNQRFYTVPSVPRLASTTFVDNEAGWWELQAPGQVTFRIREGADMSKYEVRGESAPVTSPVTSRDIACADAPPKRAIEI